jgi:hypothetical protein
MDAVTQRFSHRGFSSLSFFQPQQGALSNPFQEKCWAKSRLQKDENVRRNQPIVATAWCLVEQ